MVNYAENVVHAHAVDTRPSFPPFPLRRTGDKAKQGVKQSVYLSPAVVCQHKLESAIFSIFKQK